MVRESLGPEFVELCDKLGFDVEGMIRYKPFGDKFEAARLGRNLTIKEAAAQIKAPQYRLKAIENGHFSEILPDVLRKYAGFSGSGRLCDQLEPDQPGPCRRSWYRPVALTGQRQDIPVQDHPERHQTAGLAPHPGAGEYSFWDLHVAIQDAMGWLDCHLHQFDILDYGSRQIEHIGFPDDEFLLEQVVLPGVGKCRSRACSPRQNKKA